MKTHKKPRIGQTEDHVPWICLPQGDLPAVHSRYTHRSSALPEGPLGLPSLSLTTEGSRIHLGEGRQTSRQLFDASTLTLVMIIIKSDNLLD